MTSTNRFRASMAVVALIVLSFPNGAAIDFAKPRFYSVDTSTFLLQPSGRATVDVSGHVTGGEARSVAGGYADETFTGTQNVNSDCTGSITLNFY